MYYSFPLNLIMENLLHTLFSNNANRNMIFAAVFSLLLVLIFIYSLHCYAQRFLAQDQDGESSSSSSPIPLLLGARLYRLRDFIIVDGTNNHVNSPPARGLDSAAISSIPRFVFKPKEEEQGGEENGLECVICLSSFENGEVGRRIQSCHHAFHVECIDMWLFSHTTCPTCRAPAALESTLSNIESARVVDNSSSPNDHGIGLNMMSERDQEIEMSSNLGEIGRMSSENPSYGLEIIVEVPSNENELNGACRKKLHTSSNVCQ